jgi:large repetitive protein
VAFPHLIWGGPGSDQLEGSTGRDSFRPGPGNDVVDGRGGVDTLDLSDSRHPVDVDLPAGKVHGSGMDEVARVENVIGSRNADSIKGSASTNIVDAGNGADTVESLGGDDLG